MKKTRIVLSMLLAVIMMLGVLFTACTPTECNSKCPTCGLCTKEGCTVHTKADERCPGHEDVDPDADLLPYAEGTVLRIAAGYQKIEHAISFQNDKYIKELDGTTGQITLPNGKTYKNGDLKPTWQQISDDMGIIFEDKFTGAGSAKAEYSYWENQLDQVDIVAGTANVLQEAGAQGKLINIADYLNKMPNFKKYLDDNAIVRLSITGNTSTGAIYFSPYFDGVDDIERYPLVRADMVKTLLDGNAAYTGANRALASAQYTPYVTETGKVQVESLNAAGTATQTITKDYSKTTNIITQMNDALAKGELKGDVAVAMFRKYIDDMYGDTYENRSDLFLGYDAAWDADELVALLRCAVASLNDSDGNAIAGLFPREESNLQRQVDLFRFAGSLFGVRGLESRCDYLYFDSDGELHSARSEEDTYLAIERLNALYKEGLVAIGDSVKSEDRLKKDAGIVSYDYCQTQTVMNSTALQEGESYTCMMVPVAKWYDGTEGGVWMRFTESWRSVKTDAWAISAAGVSNADGTINTDKLNAALALIDFAFSPQGQITMSYGSDDFIKVKDASVEVKTWEDVAKKYETFDFNGMQMPVVSDEMYADLQARAGGNYTNYARYYLGSTLNGFPKSQAFEYQCTHEVGKEGAAKVSAAIALGTIKHPELAITENPWYTSIPTSFPQTAKQNTQISSYKALADNFSTSKGKNNVLINMITKGYAITEFEGLNVTNAKEAAALAAGTWNDEQYINLRTLAWQKLVIYYKDITK